MNLLWQVFVEQFGAAFLIPFATPVTYASVAGFGEAPIALTLAQAAGVFTACLVNLGIGVAVRQIAKGRIHLPQWCGFRALSAHALWIWGAVAILCFLPVFPQLMFFAGMSARAPWRLVPLMMMGCSISVAMLLI